MAAPKNTSPLNSGVVELPPAIPGAMRVTYKGSCKVPVGVARAPVPSYQKIRLSQTALKIGDQGRHEFALYDLSGNRVFYAEGGEGAEYRFRGLAASEGVTSGTPLRGVYLV